MKLRARWLWLLLAVPVVIGFTRLRLDTEVLNLLPGDSRVVQGLKLYQEKFADARELIIAVEAAEPERAETAARRIAEALRRETNRVQSAYWQAPWMEHPGQAAELIAVAWLNQSPEELSNLAERLHPTNLPTALTAIKQDLATSMSPQEIARLSYDPLGLTRLPEESLGKAGMAFGPGQEGFGSEDGRFRLVFVRAAQELPSYPECREWVEAIKAVAASAARQLDDGMLGGTNDVVRLGFTGRPVFVAEISQGMEQDMTVSVIGTSVIIAVLFWLAHRRVKPMLWLLFLLGVILAATVGLGGLIYGSINVVSVGFAAILLGLAVDYAVVHYQEALAQPHLRIPQIRRAIAPSITWAAVTTIVAFATLNFGGLPGLGQLGTLVAVGVLLAALIMIFEYLPPLFPHRRGIGSADGDPPMSGATAAKEAAPVPAWSPRGPGVSLLTALLVLGSAAVLVTGFPKMDPTADPLRPRNSSAYATLDKMKQHLSRGKDPLWVIVFGKSEGEVARELQRVNEALGAAVATGAINGYTLPAALWPNPVFQERNEATARQLVALQGTFREITLTNGFTPEAFGLAERVFETWEAAVAHSGVVWPTNAVSQWILNRFTARGTNQFYALGLVTISQGANLQSQISQLKSQISHGNSWLSGWEMLGSEVFARVQTNTWRIVLPVGGLVFASLWFAFHRWKEVFLSVGVLLLSLLCLVALMRLFGWQWNLLNLMGLPLILGTGVDYSIFMLHALRRHGGDLRVAFASVGRALLLCGGTAIAGFGSLGLSTNAGMASLGLVCALGISLNMLIAIFLLPTFWQKACVRPRAPSTLYRASLWKIGWSLVTVLPPWLCRGVAQALGLIYWASVANRRQIVRRNLEPVLGDQRLARKTTRRLFRNFAIKLVDLWRYEAGGAIEDLFGPSTGWEHFTKAADSKRGILLLTPHLGNWEFGAAWLAKRGVSLLVITLAEPAEDLTRLRLESRKRRNIETLVIGNDTFGFIEVIRRLEAGATVALLIDRPPDPTAVKVQLCGEPFAASIAAAELARASGCILLPVYLPLEGQSYAAHILPEVPYDRAAIRDRTSRAALTQRIMDAFAPAIQKHADQWYHFVPVWPETNEK